MVHQVFIYVAHRDGQAANSALELLSAARILSPDGPVTAIVTGWGEGLDRVCQEMASRCP